MTRLEAAVMRFLRSVKGYTRLDKIRSEVIRKKLEILWNTRREIQTQTKLDRWTTPDFRTHAINYKPRGRRDHGRPRKRWQRVDAGTGQST